MTKMTKYAPGTFSRVDLATTDVAAAKKFYSGLFGWQTVDMPIDDSAVYTMAQLGDDGD
ncbi:MAG: hypothetical protein R3264_21665 [Anaerolineae bacterium]|nr:hypothetical protein [Anaerolineae bacterium]